MTKQQQLQLLMGAIDNKRVIKSCRKYIDLSNGSLQLLADITLASPPESISEALSQQKVIDKITFEIAMRN